MDFSIQVILLNHVDIKLYELVDFVFFLVFTLLHTYTAVVALFRNSEKAYKLCGPVVCGWGY